MIVAFLLILNDLIDYKNERKALRLFDIREKLRIISAI